MHSELNDDGSYAGYELATYSAKLVMKESEESGGVPQCYAAVSVDLQAQAAGCWRQECTVQRQYGNVTVPGYAIVGDKVGDGPHYLAKTDCVAVLGDDSFELNRFDANWFDGAQIGWDRWERAADAIIDLPGQVTRLRGDLNLRIGAPGLAMKPRPDHTYVQFPNWLWIDGVTTEQVAVSEHSSGHIRLVMWANPLSATFTPGDGKPPVTCSMDTLIDPGNNPPDVFGAECTHTYTRAGDHIATAETEWSYSYQIQQRTGTNSTWTQRGPIVSIGTGSRTGQPQMVSAFEIQSVLTFDS